jgi:hypothetical protein
MRRRVRLLVFTGRGLRVAFGEAASDCLPTVVEAGELEALGLSTERPRGSTAAFGSDGVAASFVGCSSSSEPIFAAVWWLLLTAVKENSAAGTVTGPTNHADDGFGVEGLIEITGGVTVEVRTSPEIAIRFPACAPFTSQ